MHSEELQAPRPWYKKTAVSWIRDCIIVIAVFWAATSWQTKEMLAADGTVEIEAIELHGIDGQRHSIFERELSGKPTIVYFFAPWCSVCQASITSLNGLDTQKMNVVRIALDYRTAEQVIEFADKTRSEGPILLGDRTIKRDFQVPGYPSYYVLDKNNVVIARSMGYSTEWGMQLKSYIAKVTH